MSDEELLRVIKQPEKNEVLRVGDVVRIKHRHEVHNPDELPGYYSHMDEDGGLYAAVSEVTRNGNVHLVGVEAQYRAEWLEKL